MGLAALLCAGTALAQGRGASATLPAEINAELQRAQLPAQALVAIVQDVDGASPRLAWRPREPVNPASLMKLLTTQAALDLLGPSWRWKTPVWLDGRLSAAGDGARPGAFRGQVVIKGSGDPSLVIERLWLLGRRLQQLGVRDIDGDIVLDRSAFELPAQDPADFDGEALRPYNVRPDALLFNLKAVQLSVRPDAGAGVARIAIEPPLAGLAVDATVPLNAEPCGDWRTGLKADLAHPSRWRFAGSYPAACGERSWPVAPPEAERTNARLLDALWRSMGGGLSGQVRDGLAPTSAPPSFELESPPLADVVRDINKFSNNVMAQQLFLSLPLALEGRGNPSAARALLTRWATERLGAEADGLVVDNGSGLSRDNRVSAALLAQLLQRAWAGPTMSDLLSSLPASGLDGTLRRSRLAPGRAHLKTGSLRDVAGIAGYVLADNGRRRIVVAVLNHPNAQGGRAVLDAVTQWAMTAP